MENAGMDNYCRDIVSSRLIDSGRDTRYSLKAYEFVYMIFSILEKINFEQKEDFSPELITEKAAATAATIYGSLAEFVLADMGIKSASDIGAIIVNLTDLEIFSPSDICASQDFEILSQKPLFSKVRPKPLNTEKLKNFEDT